MKKSKSCNLIFLRNAVQASFTGFCIFVGIRFYQYYLWITGDSEIFVPRPPSVEGFLPISALMSAKKLLLTGGYDSVHPAGLTIFLAALAIALLAQKGFCGWICPVGFISGLAWKASQLVKKIKDTPYWINYPLLSLKYILLFFFTYLILLKMDVQSIESFARSPYNIIADAKMLQFFLAPSILTLWVMGFLVFLSLLIRNFWCRFLCPYGALLGLISFVSPTKIKRDKSLCIDCKKCEKQCPSAIEITRKEGITTPECIGCLECVEVCPVDKCLSPYLLQIKLPSLGQPIIVLLIFFIFYGWAILSGNWYQNVPEQLLKQYYSKAMDVQHTR